MQVHIKKYLQNLISHYFEGFQIYILGVISGQRYALKTLVKCYKYLWLGGRGYVCVSWTVDTILGKGHMHKAGHHFSP